MCYGQGKGQRQLAFFRTVPKTGQKTPKSFSPGDCLRGKREKRLGREQVQVGGIKESRGHLLSVQRRFVSSRNPKIPVAKRKKKQDEGLGEEEAFQGVKVGKEVSLWCRWVWGILARQDTT